MPRGVGLRGRLPGAVPGDLGPPRQGDDRSGTGRARTSMMRVVFAPEQALIHAGATGEDESGEPRQPGAAPALARDPALQGRSALSRSRSGAQKVREGGHPLPGGLRCNMRRALDQLLTAKRGLLSQRLKADAVRLPRRLARVVAAGLQSDGARRPGKPPRTCCPRRARSRSPGAPGGGTARA